MKYTTNFDQTDQVIINGDIRKRNELVKEIEVWVRNNFIFNASAVHMPNIPKTTPFEKDIDLKVLNDLEIFKKEFGSNALQYLIMSIFQEGYRAGAETYTYLCNSEKKDHSDHLIKDTTSFI